MSRRTLLAGAAVGGAGLAATLSDPGGALAAASGGSNQARPLAVEREPGVGLTFELEVAGIGTMGMFHQVTGLSIEFEVVEYRDGSEPDVVRKLPGRAKYPDVRLSRPVTADLALANWIKLVQDGQVAQAQKNGSIVLYDQTHAERARWNFVNAWPSKYQVDDGLELTTETLTLTHERIVRVPV